MKKKIVRNLMCFVLQDETGAVYELNGKQLRKIASNLEQFVKDEYNYGGHR
ncbi:hypothetical protein FACS1894137_08370 [Spirochaetia bacterium]|nr:hypothetical protein FACS1894137_08370 [Spirochaetia bacterium]